MQYTKTLIVGLLFLMHSNSAFAQETGIFTNAQSYLVGDTIKINFFFEEAIVLCSNKGGCGGGLEYAIVCHSNEMYTAVSEPHCDYLLMEYYYTEQGSFEQSNLDVGVYSVLLYAKDEQAKEGSPPSYKQLLYSTKFEVKNR